MWRAGRTESALLRFEIAVAEWNLRVSFTQVQFFWHSSWQLQSMSLQSHIEVAASKFNYLCGITCLTVPFLSSSVRPSRISGVRGSTSIHRRPATTDVEAIEIKTFLLRRALTALEWSI